MMLLKKSKNYLIYLKPRFYLMTVRIDKYIKETKSFTREEFTKLLSRCHNIIRNNDKLSPEASFDEISKILFMKIMYERNANRRNDFL